MHEKKSENDKSGFGFELTFRLKREAGELNPPAWPARLMQALAKYVFCTGISLLKKRRKWRETSKIYVFKYVVFYRKSFMGRGSHCLA